MPAPKATVAPTQPTAAELTALLGSVRASATRMHATLAEMTDHQVNEWSALPGWSRGHVITHVARSADAYRWLLSLARTGAGPGPRADAPAPERALREGAGRDATTLAADLRDSMDQLLDEAALMPAERWSTLLTSLPGYRHPAWFTLHRARRELEIHHADLLLGHTTADWPADFVCWALDGTTTALGARAFPVARMEATDLDRSWSLGPAGHTVSGPGHALLAWLAGRGGEAELRSPLPLPKPPPWPLAPYPGWS
ncbi:maleylpyruvate isomerase family mycothiol-dependent enzyme [Streptomyces sp. NPDC047022]|uniref:maleylpyruvate isomerase family mycothiol-dependent enzyme n=1 Tax=Streptomyces sp. NPDC047022 TaxID=3155737 RepID=UPI0033D72690